MRCHLRTNFLCWRARSVLFEGRRAILGKFCIPIINATEPREVPILVRQIKYLNNIVQQDHRAIKQVTRPMLNFKSFGAAHCVLAGVALMHMIRKGQFAINASDAMSFADQFYALAGKVPSV